MKTKKVNSRQPQLIFDTEKNLQYKIYTSKIWLDSEFSSIAIRREVPVGDCIPDLVCVRFLESPTNLLPKQWAYRHVYVLWLLRRYKSLRLETISKHTYEHPEKVSSILQDLIKSGAIIVKKSGSFSLSAGMKALRAEVVSVEAKLYRWKEALDQAIKYKSFSDISFVAMDKNGIPKNPRHISEFYQFQVGLCSVSKDEIEWIVPPRSIQTTKGPEREYLVISAAASCQTLWSFL